MQYLWLWLSTSLLFVFGLFPGRKQESHAIRRPESAKLEALPESVKQEALEGNEYIAQSAYCIHIHGNFEAICACNSNST
jgi:hypothetical protein